MVEADLFGAVGDSLVGNLLANLRRLKAMFGEGADTLPPPGTVHDYNQAFDIIQTWIAERCQPPAPCKACEEEIWFLRLPSGKSMPLTSDGTPHFANCPALKK